MMKTGKTLVTHFTVMLFLIFTAGQGILYTWLLLYQKGHLEKRQKEDVTVAAEHIKDMFALTGNDAGRIDLMLSSILKNEALLAVKIVDSGGRVIASKTRGTVQGEGGPTPFFMFYVPAVNHMSVPFGADGLGSVEVVYSGAPVNETMKRFLLIPPLMQLMTFLIILFAVVKFFQSKVGRPVAKINATLAKITEGDLTAEMPELGSSEMGSIAGGVTFLVGRLSRTIERSYSISGNVVTAMGQLTVALKNVSDTARKQATAIDDVVAAVVRANAVQRDIRENSEKLSNASSENVTSLLEMKATAEEIASSTVRLFKSTESSYAMIAQMSQTAKVIAGNTGEVFGAIENTSSSVEEISASLNEVLDNARKSAQYAAKVREHLTESGTLAIADAIEAMEKIIDEVNHSALVIARLHDRSKSIEKILSVIKEVTESTNLLSLNAAILAAQAGEYGKSFTVVANEIRGLSDRTSSSAREIANIVRTIQGEIDEADRSIKMSVGKTETGKELIFKAGEAMGVTLEAAQKAAKMSGVIEKATDEQALGLRQITLSMESFRDMIGQVAKATEEQQKGSGHMLESIGDVKEVAELVKRGTEEHAAGTRVISGNLELTFEMAAKINDASQEQQKTNKDIVATVQQMKKAGASAVRDMEELTASFDTLKNEVESLNREIGVFTLAAHPAAERARE